MRTALRLLIGVISGFLLLTGSASAVQYGQPDGDGHPYVGVLVLYDAAGVPYSRCTGTLIAPTVVLTAGHCTGDGGDGIIPASTQIWFDSGPIVPGDYPYGGVPCAGFTGYPCTGGVTGTPHPDPLGEATFFESLPDIHDIGVVTLDRPVTDRGLGVLAPAGFLDSLATRRGLQDMSVTLVGYGLQGVKPVFIGLRERYVGSATIVDLNSALTRGFSVGISNNPGLGDGPGGDCFGDSGSPILHLTSSGQSVIVAVFFGLRNVNCKGTTLAYRTDSDAARSFLAQYVNVP
jgi:hypothetical protein